MPVAESVDNSKYGVLGLTGNWFGDDKYGFPSLFADSINEVGLSCGLQTLINTKYQSRSLLRENVFAGTFCIWATSHFANVLEVKEALGKVSVWGPDLLAQHFILHDALGTGLILEVIDGEQRLYIDSNDQNPGVGITTNEPSLDWHWENIKHYEWKRTLARQAIVIPGNFYPDDRFLRIHMIKKGMSTLMENTVNIQEALALTSQGYI